MNETDATRRSTQPSMRGYSATGSKFSYTFLYRWRNSPGGGIAPVLIATKTDQPYMQRCYSADSMPTKLLPASFYHHPMLARIKEVKIKPC